MGTVAGADELVEIPTGNTTLRYLEEKEL